MASCGGFGSCAGNAQMASQARTAAFGSVSDKELCMAAKLADACYSAQPAPICNEETSYTSLTLAEDATTYFSFPGSRNAQAWSINALSDMRPLGAWAERLPGFEGLPQLAHRVKRQPQAEHSKLKLRHITRK